MQKMEPTLDRLGGGGVWVNGKTCSLDHSLLIFADCANPVTRVRYSCPLRPVYQPK